MKKTLLAAALLGSFAASAFAAPSVTLYGIIDTGLNYTHYRADDGKTIICQNNFRHSFSLTWSGKTCDIRRSL